MELKNEYTFTNERGEVRTISRLDEARAVIVSTAMVRMHNREDLLQDKELQEVAAAFGIDLEDVTVESNEDPNDFPFTYHI